MKQEVPQDALLKMIKGNWFIIVFFASLIISWTTFTNKVATLEAFQEKTEQAIALNRDSINAQNSELNLQLTEMKIQLTKIQTTVENLDRTLQGFDIAYQP